MTLIPSIVFSTNGPYNHFFGYYDKSPLDRACKKLLCLRTDFNDRIPGPEDKAEIGYWDIHNPSYHKLSETKAFNWQQGCMLQWLGPNFDRYIIYNDRESDRFVSIILDITNKEAIKVPFPIYSVHYSGIYAMSVDFERHYFPRRGYAYAGIVKPEKNADLVMDDGIFLIDLKKKTSNLVISTRQMYERKHLSSMECGAHYLEHLMFSPTGERFLFLHRWELEDGGVYSRVYTAGVNGDDIRCLLDTGKATHYCWHGNQQVFLWGGVESKLAGLRRYQGLVRYVFNPFLPIYHTLVDNRSKIAKKVTGTSFLLIDDIADATPIRFAPDDLIVDGHPSWNPFRHNWLLTDTYQDNHNYQHLYLYNIRKAQLIEIGKYFLPPQYSNSPIRCDLHPRWDLSGRFVCIDSLKSGSRQMYLFDVGRILEAS